MEKFIRSMKNKVSTFIFAHTQEIILDCIHKNRFSTIENLKYVFLSLNDSSKIENMNNVIICKNYDDNLEHYPKLTSFTGWYILAKHDLINTEYVNLFEYDVNLMNQFEQKLDEKISQNSDFVGYVPMLIEDPVYVKAGNLINELINSIKNKIKIDIIELINSQPPFSLWSSSSNSTWKKDLFINYVNWFYQFIEDIVVSQYCGHMHERSISFYLLIQKISPHFINNCLTHHQCNSHETSGFAPGRFDLIYPKL